MQNQRKKQQTGAHMPSARGCNVASPGPCEAASWLAASSWQSNNDTLVHARYCTRPARICRMQCENRTGAVATAAQAAVSCRRRPFFPAGSSWRGDATSCRPRSAGRAPQPVRVDECQLQAAGIYARLQVPRVELPPVGTRLRDGQDVPARGHSARSMGSGHSTAQAHTRGGCAAARKCSGPRCSGPGNAT